MEDIHPDISSIVPVRWGSQTLFLHTAAVSPLSASEAKQNLSTQTGLSSDRMKLVSSGRLLCDGDLISPGMRLTLIGSTETPITSTSSDPLLRNDLGNDPAPHRKYSVSLAKLNQSQSGRDVHSTYRFHAIETLDLPQRDRAIAILTELASDPGVLAVLSLHQWSVGCLAELYPEGYVGVSDVCVMGLNQNRGAKILLRLRTDDLAGFRPMTSIRQVLCHELAHNEHGEHGDDFFRLMRTVEREVGALDWRRGRFRATGAALARMNNTAGDNRRVNGTQRLGGGAVASSLLAMEPRPVEDNDNDDIGFNETEQYCLPCVSDVNANETMMIIEEKEEERGAAVVPAEDKRGSSPAAGDSLGVPHLVAVLAVLDDVAASVFQLGDETLLDRALALRAGIEGMATRLPAEELRETLHTLSTVVGNAKDRREAKYESINKSSKTFTRVVEQRGGVSFLLAAGFSDRGSAVVLTRRDDALLYIASSMLQAANDALLSASVVVV